MATILAAYRNALTPASDVFSDSEAKREAIVHAHFEPQLAQLGLSEDQIEKQDLDELHQSLAKVNDAISHAESFGTLKFKLTANAGLVLTAARQDAHIESTILPLLLERKSLILKRIKSLVGEQKVTTLNDLVASVADPELRAKIETELSAVAEQSRRLAEQESAVAKTQSEEISKRDQALATLRIELFERRLRALTGFFARESMATYIGAFLLIVVTVVQIVSMFSNGGYKSEIINNAFLLLLGYFFGQSGTRTVGAASHDAGG